ncbi:MAG: HEAT repeat domain-containing protein [Desulfuromonadales bacterium]|nr:HEAT repeat domain-containing protein [Desulfuromonadales bacterium]
MQNDNELHNLIATALTGLVKQIKAIRYYPAKHPALQATAEECLRSFEPILTGGNHLSLTVRKEGFLFDDSQIAKTNQVLVQLANFCFARRIQYLTFLPDLNSSDLHHFVHYLLLDPQIIQKQGGIQIILEKARLTTIWTNVRDLDDILQRKEEIEELPEEEDFDPAAVLTEDDDADENQAQADAMNMETLLAKMEQEQVDARFQRFIQELIPLLRLQLVDESRGLVLRAFLLFCRCATGKQYSEERKQDANQALDQLATEEITNYLVAYMFATETNQKDRNTLVQILTFLGSKIANRLMEILANESSAPKRKLLNEILARIGQAALPIIYEYLSDERWYVVRNAIAILGDIRNQGSLAQLTPLLQHDDIRVRRETIRALTKIGGNRAIKILLQTAAADDQELRRQAIISLGAIRAASAIPTLLSLLKKSDWSQRAIDLKKDTIRALGEIKDPEAIPELTKIISKKSWLHRQLNDELRTAAAAALGDIADENTRKVLEKATHDRTAAVARAAAHALKQLDKANT